MRGSFEYRFPHYCDLLDTVREAQDKLGELEREVKAQDGPDQVTRLRVAAKARDPDKRDALIHRNALESDALDWTDVKRDRKAELEDNEQGRVQAGPAGLWGDSGPDAESGDGNEEAGEGEEGQDVRPLQQTNAYTFLD